MAPNPHLIERSGDLKQDLVRFARGSRFRRALIEARMLRFPPGSAVNDADFVSFLDWFILQHRLPDGRVVVDHFVAAHPELPEAERNMLLGWKDVVEGIFRAERREGDALILANLIDELTYPVYSNMGPDVFSRVPAGAYLITRLAPVEDAWLISGHSRLYPASDRAEVLRIAAELALQLPALSFRNPAKLEQAWELQREDRRDFIAFFGSDLVVIPGHELQERLRAYAHFKMYEVRNAKGRTAAELAEKEYGQVPPLVVPELPEALLAAETVGVIYDEVEGINFFPEFGRVAETFASPDLVADDLYREAVLGYLRSPDIAPLPLRRLVERDLERANRVFRTALRQPHFSWERDGEALLRRYKASYFDRPPLPSITPVSDSLARAQQSASRAPEAGFSHQRPGRNEPCPCGSGKKYKRCCGR
jgi:SEC-C motif